jgi:hypothetical protein
VGAPPSLQHGSPDGDVHHEIECPEALTAFRRDLCAAICALTSLAKLRYLQPYFTGLGLQVALVVGIASGRAALVTLGVAQPIRLRFQKLLHAAPHHPIEVVLDPIVVDRDDIMAAPSRLIWLRLATSKSARFGAASPTYLIAVGTPITEHPPHRSVRARFGHRIG